VADLEVACGAVVVVVVVVVDPSDGEEESLVDVAAEVEDVVPSRDELVVVVVVLAAVPLDPACWSATTTPTMAVEAVAAITAACVMRRKRAFARSRASGAFCSMGGFTAASFGGVPSWNHPGLSLDREPPVGPV